MKRLSATLHSVYDYSSRLFQSVGAVFCNFVNYKTQLRLENL